MLATTRLEPFVFQWAAAELLRSDDFVEEAVRILRPLLRDEGLSRTGCRHDRCGFEWQLFVVQKAALVRSGTALSDWPARAEVKQLLASKRLSSRFHLPHEDASGKTHAGAAARGTHALGAQA